MDLCEDTYSVYDSLIYPQVSKGIFGKLISFSNADFKEPDRRNEGELCFELYLGEYFSPVQLSSDDVMIFSSKLQRVYDSLMSSKKVCTRSIKNSFMILNVFGETFEKVCEQGITAIMHCNCNDCRYLMTGHINFWLTHNLILNAFFSV